jgi:hypothetical protein
VTRRLRAAALAALVSAPLAFGGCGKKGPPRPPERPKAAARPSPVASPPFIPEQGPGPSTPPASPQ